MHTLQVAITKDFLRAYDRIPQQLKKKTREFLDKFRANPTAASINYERIVDVSDDRVRTVRIDKKYRAVILHPDTGNTYMLVWVDNHDEAMAWARRKSFDINPTTGAFQIVDTEFVKRTIAEIVPVEQPAHTLFSWLSDDDLRQIGLPDVLFPAVRPLQSATQLDRLAAYLPEEVYEALYYVAHGDSVQEALTEIKRNQPDPIVTDDLDTALQHPDTLRRVAMPESADDLNAILNAPLADWRVFLHPDQRGLVTRHFNGPARVLGGAGTGKTVVALHRAAHLARNVFDGAKDRLLFTTYTRNLAANIQGNLTHLCPDVVDRIDVYNLHRWAYNFLKQQGQLPKTVSGDELRAVWQQAVREAGDGSYSDSFYQAEWENVMIANGIDTQQAYLRIRRRGQLDPLNRKQRLIVWRVFERYLDLMDGRITLPQLSFAALQFIEQHQPDLPYRTVIVDEVQDLFPVDLKLLRAIVPEGQNDLFLVGDAHQRIYSSQPVVMSHVGIQIRGRSRRLRINYRTTEQIRNYAVNVLAGIQIDDMNGGVDSQTDHRSLRVGTPPIVQFFTSQEDEVLYVLSEVERLQHDSDVAVGTIAIVARASYLLKPFENGLNSLGLAYTLIDPQSDSSKRNTERIRLATMHRVKGLEFAHVFMVGLNDGVMPDRRVIAMDDTALQERCLFHVAATRARDTLTLTCSGRPSRFIS